MGPDQLKQILVLYRPGATRGQLIGDRGSHRTPALEEGVDYHSEYIDRARFEGADYRKAFGSFLRSKYAGQQFDVVIAMQDVALALVGDNRDTLFASTPVVFVSTLGDSPRIPNSTGVVSPLNLRTTLSMALELQPDIRNVFVVSGADEGARVSANGSGAVAGVSVASRSPTDGLPMRTSMRRFVPPDRSIVTSSQPREGGRPCSRCYLDTSRPLRTRRPTRGSLHDGAWRGRSSLRA